MNELQPISTNTDAIDGQISKQILHSYLMSRYQQI